MEPETTHPKKKKRRYKLLIYLVLFIIALRIALPFIVLHYANKSLAHMHGYYGKIRDIDLHLYRGAYKIKDFYLHKKDTLTSLETEFLDIEEVDLSIQWSALFDGRIVGEFDIETPVLAFTKDKVEPKEVAQDTTDFRIMLKNFMPLEINRFEVHNGSIRYLDKTSSPKVDIGLTNLFVKAENLSSVKTGAILPAEVTVSADVYEGSLGLNLKLDPLADDPTFDLNAEVKDINLVKLNDFFKAYGKLDINKGRFGIYLEAAAKSGKFVGYFKPFIKDLDVLGPEDKDDNLLKQLWEGAAGAVGVIFRNQRHDQVATKVEIEGTIEKRKVKVFGAVIDILRNAFIEALRPSIDHEINLGTVDQGTSAKGPLKDLLKKDKDEAQEEPGTKMKVTEPEQKEEKKGLFKKIFKGKNKKGETSEEKPKEGTEQK